LDFARYLLLGLATSVHCVAMCGSLVMTYSIRQDASGGVLRRLTPHLAYQGAKILSYMAVAVVLGTIAALVGSALDLTSFRNWVMVIAGGFMVLLGASMTGYFPWLVRLTPRPPAFLVRLLSRNRKRAIEESTAGRVSLATPITFGLLTGLMPCAPLIAAQAGAMSVASPVRGAVLMLGFGLGTAPLMLLLGVVSGLLGATFRRRMQYVAAAAVVIFGLVILNRGLMLVGSPVTFDTMRQVVTGAAPAATTGATEQARADLVIENTRFVPETVAVPADRPVSLVVDRREDDACSDQLAIPQLGVLVDLKPFAKTTVDLPATGAGSYTLTCGMGMMSGRIVFGAADALGPSRIALGLIAVALLGVVGWVLLRSSRVVPATGVVCEDGAEPAASARTILGFTPAEALVVAVAVAVAVAAGLWLGGMLR
jgi:sulfite exporter TauE/SafE